ncbi:MAG: GNAT family N-acetyltransferase [Burkholderiaceae bacterium]
MDEIAIQKVNLDNPGDIADLTRLLNEYAGGEAGGGQPLAQSTLDSLPVALKSCPTYVGLLARANNEAIGLLNAFWSVSTFKARRLINVHDIAVTPAWQRKGIGRRLLNTVEEVAVELHCCKITLEVLEGNHNAVALYQIMGFEAYRLHPAMGAAQFMQKVLRDKP